MKKLPDSYIGTIFHECKNLDEIAMALVHSDEKTVKRFLETAAIFRRNIKDQLENLIKIILTSQKLKVIE